jgi:hypothetical protein
MQKQTFTVKGETFESPYSDKEIFERLTAALEGGWNSRFAMDLCVAFNRYSRWTDGQRQWAHKLVIDREKPREVNLVAGFKPIVDHLRHCRESRDAGGKGLLNPMVRIPLGEGEICLKLAGKNSRNPGYVSVASSHKYGEGQFYGWIDDDGNLDRRKSCGDDVIGLLNRVAADPANVINELGKELGRCCYCWAELSQVQSKIVGCGKKCASNYGVPYPNAAETREFVASHPEVLEGATDADRWS